MVTEGERNPDFSASLVPTGRGAPAYRRGDPRIPASRKCQGGTRPLSPHTTICEEADAQLDNARRSSSTWADVRRYARGETEGVVSGRIATNASEAPE